LPQCTSWRVRGRKVVSCLSGDVVKIKSLRLETTNLEEIKEMVHTEVGRRLGLNPDQDEIRYIVAGNAYQGEDIKNEVIFFGIENNSFRSILHCWKRRI